MKVEEIAHAQNERLMRLIGDAFVTWSEIEEMWRQVFPRVLFRGMKAPDNDCDMLMWNGETRIVRANALWDSLNSSDAQMKLLMAVAPHTLNGDHEKQGLADLLAAAKETGMKRALRNALAHSGFIRAISHRQGDRGALDIITEEIVVLTDSAHKQIRGKDPLEEIPRIIEQLTKHREEVRRVLSWVIFG